MPPAMHSRWAAPILTLPRRVAIDEEVRFRRIDGYSVVDDTGEGGAHAGDSGHSAKSCW